MFFNGKLLPRTLWDDTPLEVEPLVWWYYPIDWFYRIRAWLMYKLGLWP